MKTCIIGYAGSGKSELFAALAGPAAGTGRAMVKVPEPRLKPLADLFKPKKVTETEIEFVDTPGGVNARVINDVRPADCLLVVLDAFSGAADPKEQRDLIETEFIIADLASVEKRLERMAQDKKKSRDLVDPGEEKMLARARDVLDSEQALRGHPDLAEAPELRGFKFLSAKPVLYAWNVSEDKVEDFQVPEDSPGLAHLAVSARLERELAEIEDPDERAEFLSDLGLESSALDRVIKKTYSLLGLITFITAGGTNEARAWPLRKGSTAWDAAGVLHTDMQKGFIRAEVLAWDDFLKCGDFKTAKDKGLMRLEGKTYVVKDGDIITFRFNV